MARTRRYRNANDIPRHSHQEFEKLALANLLQDTLFEDPFFPPGNSSLFFTARSNKITWKRPWDIVDDPQFFVDGASRFDVRQGELGNCWLLAAIANLTTIPQLFNKVVPHDQSFGKEKYAGIFRFKFWRFGKWTEVVVDDLLPTRNGKLIYLHSSEKNEFWSALLEKAYAKVHGCYEALKGGRSVEALVDLTGGLSEIIDLNTNSENLFEVLLQCIQKHSLITGSIVPRNSYEVEKVLPCGLIVGHAYSVFGVEEIQLMNNKGSVQLLRIRNPWGVVEWKKAWSDNSPEWNDVPTSTKRELKLVFEQDGEFWISFKDFTSIFTFCEICHLGPDAMNKSYSKSKLWNSCSYDGEWVRGSSAGGCRNYLGNTVPGANKFRLCTDEGNFLWLASTTFPHEQCGNFSIPIRHG